jgi:hypothetical protein
MALVQGPKLLGLGKRTVRKITYGDLAAELGYSHQAGRTLSRQLGMIGKFCKLNGLPCLNTLVVNAITDECGDEVVVSKGRNSKQERRAVMDFNWFEVGVPTTGTFRKVWAAMKDEDL